MVRIIGPIIWLIIASLSDALYDYVCICAHGSGVEFCAYIFLSDSISDMVLDQECPSVGLG